MIAADLMPVMALDTVLDGITHRYGRATAKGVALAFEYPDFPHCRYKAPMSDSPDHRRIRARWPGDHQRRAAGHVCGAGQSG
ncbi:hypothetical protein [Xanthomonas arboricola]|uniref:hypothetical protein n=1 Tax=Xanthomonas arboricola TaxID=56448 RepID=UPI00187B66F4|nr:hypothetical protein [Xanthomonas arboricola]